MADSIALTAFPLYHELGALQFNSVYCLLDSYDLFDVPRGWSKVVHYLISYLALLITQTILCDDRQHSTHCFSTLPWVGAVAFQFSILQFIWSFYAACINKVLERFSFSFHTCITSNTSSLHIGDANSSHVITCCYVQIQRGMGAVNYISTL
jgi:hypothetical protein